MNSGAAGSRRPISREDIGMTVIERVMGGVLLAVCIWYILLLYKNNRNKL